MNMKAKLHKMESGYILSLNGDIDDPYAIVNEELAKDYEWYKLSLKNCQAIERGYDLDELAKMHHKLQYCDAYNPDIAPYVEADYKSGFQKALEVNDDKRFTLEDMMNCWKYARQSGLDGTDVMKDSFQNYLQSFQQNEWDVEIVTEPYVKYINRSVYPPLGIQNKLDTEGNLILKRK